MRFSYGPCFHFMLAAIITLAGRSEGQLDINSIGEGLNQFISKGIDVLRPLLTQTVDFSNIAPGIEILMRNLKINSRRLFSPPELRMLERMLSGLSLDERMKTWGLTAKYLQLFEPSIRQFLLTDLNLFENDVVLTERNIRALIAEAEDLLNATFAPQRRRRKRKIIVNSTEKWNSDVIPWHIETQLFAPSEVAMVRKGLQQWQEETCLTFSEKQNRPAGDYINFNKGFGCASYIGKIGGRQDISLDGDVCFSLGVVMHEIGHALGMWHEQSRPDRDEYVTLVKSNIKLGLLGQFQQRTWDTVDSIAIPYDYGSVMHYGRKDFSFNSQDTLKAKWYGYEQTIGQVSRASFHDVKIVNYWYCKNKCSTYTLEWSLCENDGYQDPRKCDQCKCPDGFKQPFCKEIQDHTIANCGKNELQASPSWRTLESPGYPNMVAGPGACTWRIKAPVGSRVELKFVDEFDLARPSQEACEDYIEVRYRDLALTGPRFCGFNKPFQTFVSEDLSILLLLRKVHKKGSYKGFKLQYRAVGCGGCNPNSPRSQHACVETYRYSCGVRFNCNWLGRKFCLRANTCFKTIYTCCAGYQKNGQTCIKI